MAHTESPGQRLQELGLVLPDVGKPAGKYVTALTAGDVVYLSGHGPLVDGKPVHQGRVPSQIDIATAREAARLTALTLLATLQHHLGGLDRVEQLVKLTGFVNAEPDFTEHARVIDGASELLLELIARVRSGSPETGRSTGTSE